MSSCSIRIGLNDLIEMKRRKTSVDTLEQKISNAEWLHSAILFSSHCFEEEEEVEKQREIFVMIIISVHSESGNITMFNA